DPLRVLVVEGFVNGDGDLLQVDITEKARLQEEDLFVSDLSAVEVDNLSGNLLLLSDESQMVVEYAPGGKAISLLGLRRGFHGLQRSVPQAEGMALDNARRLYIVSEPNLFYRFSPVEPCSSGFRGLGQQPGQLIQLGFIEHPYTVAAQRRCGDALAGDPGAGEAAVVGFTVTAGRAARLEHRVADTVLPDPLQRQLRTRHNGAGHIPALGIPHLRSAVQPRSPLPPGDLRWLSGRWQATGDLRAQRHHPPLGLPLPQ